MKDERLARLVQLAAAISDRKLGAYHEATARCAETRMLMQALDAPPPSDLPLIAAAAAQHVLLLARLNALADDGHPRRVALLLELGALDTHPKCPVRR